MRVGEGGGVCGGLAHFEELCIPSSLSLVTSFFLLFICTGSSLYRDQIDLHILAWSTCIYIHIQDPCQGPLLKQETVCLAQGKRGSH